MLELTSNHLTFSFPEVHPAAKVVIAFQRTLRIPDDDKAYPLPPGLGLFPVRHVEDFTARLPEKWKKRGGVMVPLFQSEALWIAFSALRDPERGVPYPFAIKVAAGKQSALTGKEWSKKLKEKDYCVVPPQPWLDGYVVDDGFIRQFIAMPLGGGFTVEEQLTGKAEFGGVQIEAIPMKREEYERRFPKLPPRPSAGLPRARRSVGASGMSLNKSLESYSQTKSSGHTLISQAFASPEPMSFNYCSDDVNIVGACAAEVQSMGLGAGGRMKQQVFEDPYGLSTWDTNNKTRCFVHLANSMTWRTITNEEPPTVPLTAADYTRHGYPWFDMYADAPALNSTKALKGIKTVKQVGDSKGMPTLPENQSVAPTHIHVYGKTSPKQVKDGVWK